MKKSAEIIQLHEGIDSLSEKAQNLWREVTSEYQFGSSERAILRSGLEAFDRCLEAKEVLDRDGIVIEDRWSQKKPHPAVTIERDSRSQFLMAMKALNLHLSSVEE